MRRNAYMLAFLVAAFLPLQSLALSCVPPESRAPKDVVFTGTMLSIESIQPARKYKVPTSLSQQNCGYRSTVRVDEVISGDVNVDDVITIEQRHWICPLQVTLHNSTKRYALYAPKEGVYYVGMCDGLFANGGSVGRVSPFAPFHPPLKGARDKSLYDAKKLLKQNELNHEE